MVEIKLEINPPHLKFVRESLSSIGVDVSDWKDDQPQSLTIRRTLLRRRDTARARLKSVCTVNGHVITLKALSALTSPLLVVVDAPAAAAALARPDARVAMLDAGVDPTVRQFFAVAQRALDTADRAAE